ncbi:hypothetical protein K6H09_003129 [Candida tropicalis]
MNSGFTTNHQFYTYIPSTTTTTTSNKLLIFLHGLGSSQNFYYSLISHFPDLNILLIDNEGAGNSKLFHENLTLNDLSKNVVSIVQELGFINHELILVGHSMSGMLVNYMNLYTNLKIIQNILIAPVHSTKQLSNAMNSRIDILNKSQELSPLANTIPISATGPQSTGLQKAFIRQLILGNSVKGYCANCKAIISGENYEFNYEKINVPTLLVYGEYDKTSPWIGCIEEISNGLSKVVTLKKLPVGHWIAIEDDQGLVTLMKEFIR